MRKRISECNKFPSFDIYKEYKKIQLLFCSKCEFGFVKNQKYSSPSLTYNYFLEKFFLRWNLRGTFTSLSEMIESLGIGDNFFNKFPSEARFLDYIQFIVNAMNFVDLFVEENSRKYYRGSSIIKWTIKENISFLADRFGVEFSEEDNEIFLSYKNDVASVIAARFPKIKGKILDYQKIDNRDDLLTKAELLCTFSKTLEPYEKLFKNSAFSFLCSDTTMLLNNSGIRHCIQTDHKIGNIFNSMSDEDKIKWYDRTFEMFIACMAVIPYFDYKDEIKKIKSGEFV